MTVRISELTELSSDLSQSDILPIVDLSAGETKQISVANLLDKGISGAPSYFIDLSKLNQNSATKLSSTALDNTGVASGVYGSASAVAQFTVNSKGLVIAATGVSIAIAASNVTGLAPVATSGTYNSLTGLPTLGTLSSQNAGSIAVSGGTISGVTFISNNVAIQGGTISGITDLAIADGGTGASTASGARANLGLVIGSNVQAYSSSLNQLSTAFDSSNIFVYSSASGVVATGAVGTTGLAVLSGASASGIRSTIGLGSIAIQDANSVGISGGAISGVTLASNSVNISGGTISGITDLAISDGGTGASNASDARTNLGLAVGSNVQGYSPILASIATQFDDSDELIYASASGVVSSTPFTSFGRSIVSGSTASQVRSTLGLGSIASQDAGSIAISGGTISGVTFSANNVTISGGTIVAITDLAIADGGTGASTASNARANLGLAIGTDVQAYNANLGQVAGAFDTANVFAYSSASGVIATGSVGATGLAVISGASASGVRSTIGLGTIAVQDASSVSISGGAISGVTIISGGVDISGGTISGITDLAIADGGTGASNASDARTNLGLVVGTDVQAYSSNLAQAANVFDTANRFAYSSASGVVNAGIVGSVGLSVLADSTASGVRSTLNLGTLAVQNANSVGITGGTIDGVTFSSASATISGGTITNITDLAIADGGTGASSASDARTNLGLVIGSNVQAYNGALQNVADNATAGDLFFYTTASGSISAAAFSSVARGVVSQATISGMRNALGLGAVSVLNAIAVGSGDIATGAVLADALASDSVTTSKIAVNAVSFDRIAQTSQSNVLLGRATISGGNIEEIPCTAAARSILDDASVADIRTTLGLGTLATQNGSFSGTSTGTNTGDQTIVLTGDVSGTGTSSFAVTIADSAISNSKLADLAVGTSKVASGAITAIKLADQSTSVVSAAAPSASGAFIGQQWFNTNNGYEYTWTGSQWSRQSALNSITASGDIVYAYATTYADAYSALITPSLNTQVANRVFVGPASGNDAAPTFRALQANDLPAATSSTQGAVYPGGGLSMTGSAIGHTNSVASGVYYKVQVDAQGHVSSGATTLASGDIPDLDAAKITTGTFSSTLIADDAITATKLSDYSTTRFGEAAPTADFTGQFFFNPLQKDLFLWDGNVWNPVGVSIGEIVFAGTYNASGNVIATVTSEGDAAGLTVGQPLPAASATFNRYYVVVASGGTGTSPAPAVALSPPDIVLCNGTTWTEIDVSSTYTSQTAAQIGFTPAASISAVTVQAAIEEVSNECRSASNLTSGTLAVARGGTNITSYTKGDLIVASGTTVLSKLTVGSNAQVLTADSTQSLGVKWATPASGTVLSVNATAPLYVVSGTTNPQLTISGATTSTTGVVQLSDSTSTTSSVLAATSTAVKSAYDLANAALPKAGGTVTGQLLLGNTGSLVFEGATNDAFETTLAVADPTAARTITLPNVTGTVITTGDSATVTNAMLAGSIADTKLSTISTASKVSNSATTATSVNTPSAIVARDVNGDFSAGTITATIDDGTY